MEATGWKAVLNLDATPDEGEDISSLMNMETSSWKTVIRLGQLLSVLVAA